jgi:hypothetical protein
VELDDNNRIKSLPPILIGKYKQFFGMPKNRFLHQIMHDYADEKYLVIQVYRDDGMTFLQGWGTNK